MTNPELIVLKRKLEVLAEHIENIDSDIKKARNYFRWQNSELDSLSEGLIVSWQDFKEIDSLIDNIKDLISENN